MVTDDGKFSYESDVLWLVEQARPYYYSIILILVYFEFFGLALFYALAALSLIWEVDEVDRIEEDLNHETLYASQGVHHRVVNLEIMLDYLENVVMDPHFSNNDPLFTDYFDYLDSYLIIKNIPNIFILEQAVPYTQTAFDKQKLVKMDAKIETATQYREFNFDVIKEKLMEFKVKTLTSSHPKTRALVNARMKKLVELTKQFEYDLLVYKISVESHNVVMLGLYLKMGLYPISEYDFDVVVYSDANSIVYTDYLFYYFFNGSDLAFYETDDDLDVDEDSNADENFIFDLDHESKSDFCNL